jgi:hypothetical protein
MQEPFLFPITDLSDPGNLQRKAMAAIAALYINATPKKN